MAEGEELPEASEEDGGDWANWGEDSGRAAEKEADPMMSFNDMLQSTTSTDTPNEPTTKKDFLNDLSLLTDTDEIAQQS